MPIRRSFSVRDTGQLAREITQTIRLDRILDRQGVRLRPSAKAAIGPPADHLGLRKDVTEDIDGR